MSFRTASIALVLALFGCGTPGVHVNSNDRVVSAPTADNRSVNYSFGPIPESWERIDIPENDVAWHDRTTDAVIHVDHSCAAGQDVPLPSLVQHLLIGFTDREYVSEDNVPFDAREARHAVVRARLDGVAMMVELYVLKKDGCVFDIGIAATPARFDQTRASFDAFAHGFGTVQPGSAR